MNNKQIRVKMIDAGVKQWQLAEMLGISETHMSRKLRKELTAKEKEKILRLLEKYDGATETVEDYDATGKWIPCGSKLPEAGKPCLVTVKGQNMRGYAFYSVLPDVVRYDGKNWGGTEGWTLKNPVVAWCYLPEPYKGGGA